MCDVEEESKGTVIQFFSNRGSKWHQKTKAGQASEQTPRNMTAIKVTEILAMGCYCD